jgi:hypothetical protein
VPTFSSGASRIPKSGDARTAHLPNMEISGEFNRIVLEFLDGLRV